ncbi:hypothetical protein B0H13DRAFT_2340466 [Mycena leptocephala]|nr:hypothetical protein B0H13DRAFT_2340466 [Mycena leptocephala]
MEGGKFGLDWQELVEDGATAPASLPQQERDKERQRNLTVSPRTAGSGSGQRMHTARACDGGRTRSGGVRGVLA